MLSLKSRKKGNRALSGAITALILVIASVIIALIVVGYVFGLFGAFASSPNIHLINAYISSSSGTYYLVVTVSNTGSANGQILGAVIEAGGGATSVSIPAVTVSAGSTTVFTVSFTTAANQISSLSPGEQVTFYIVTNTGAQIAGTATVLS